MKSAPASAGRSSAKAPTGIAGFAEITGGGLPRGRTTQMVGGSDSGKTILGLQFLVHSAQERKKTAYRVQVWSLTGC